MLSCSLLAIQDSAFAHVVDTHANLHSIAGSILMWFIRILPLMVQVMMLSLSRRTLNIAFGRASSTVPNTTTSFTFCLGSLGFIKMFLVALAIQVSTLKAVFNLFKRWYLTGLNLFDVHIIGYPMFYLEIFKPPIMPLGICKWFFSRRLWYHHTCKVLFGMLCHSLL